MLGIEHKLLSFQFYRLDLINKYRINDIES